MHFWLQLIQNKLFPKILSQKDPSVSIFTTIEFLEGPLTIIPRPTLFGGEIQIWLAMAYEANNRHADCITLSRQLEQKHPSINIRRQAAELRYILQAPKLKISEEEMVTIPLIGSNYDRELTECFKIIIVDTAKQEVDYVQFGCERSRVRFSECPHLKV